MRLIEANDRYEAESTYDERTIPKGAGFRWDPASKVWYTNYPDVAAALIQYADASLKARILEAADRWDIPVFMKDSLKSVPGIDPFWRREFEDSKKQKIIVRR
ncbi:MAG: hypothetical protein M0Q91_18455 [Methanoregula sp.]|jgi:hypothetical protein|nr:hypothetical protein [Methanoregula sp.]